MSNFKSAWLLTNIPLSLVEEEKEPLLGPMRLVLCHGEAGRYNPGNLRTKSRIPCGLRLGTSHWL